MIASDQTVPYMCPGNRFFPSVKFNISRETSQRPGPTKLEERNCWGEGSHIPKCSHIRSRPQEKQFTNKQNLLSGFRLLLSNLNILQGAWICYFLQWKLPTKLQGASQYENKSSSVACLKANRSPIQLHAPHSPLLRTSVSRN